MPEYNAVKRGDELIKTDSGAMRSSEESKERLDLVPWHPMARIAKHYSNGEKKYPPNENGEANWVAGLSMRRCIGAVLRHTWKYLAGDRSEDHLAAACWNLFTVMDHEERIERGLLDAKYNDLPKTKVLRPDEFEIR